MASITTAEYITKPGVSALVLFKTRLKNFDTNEEALEAFNSLVQRYTLECGDLDVQADGTMFQADFGNGTSKLFELKYDS